MSAFLFRFEAIESRIASYSCPRGATGRIHTIRLRRSFRSCNRSKSLAASEHQPIPPQQQCGPSHIESKPLTEIQPHAARERDELRRILRNATGRDRMRGGGWRRLAPAAYGEAVQSEHTAGLNGVPDERTLYKALRTGNPQVVLEALMTLVRSDGGHTSGAVLSSVPPNTFSEILRILDPNHFVSRYENIHKEISPHLAKILGLPAVDRAGYHHFCNLFLSQVQGIVEARHQKLPLSLPDFRYLLKCARAVGNVKAAVSIWNSMTKTRKSSNPDGKEIVPDVECYNHYLSVKCWADTMNPNQRYRLRVIPNNVMARSWAQPPYSLSGHQVGPEAGIQRQVSGVVRRMAKSGVAGNEETFCLMITALAREGDVTGIASILQRVWEIDVDAVMSKDELSLPAVKSYALDSPFYPSKRLLYALSHAYGINNSIPTALRLVDYISRQYYLQIPLHVWNELLQWTFVLSVKRTGVRLEDGSSKGQLPKEAVSNLWATMTSEPYYVKPTMEMYDRLIINLLKRQRFGDAKLRMEEARTLHKRAVLELSRRILVFNHSTGRGLSPVTESQNRDITFASLRVRRNRQYIRRWVRILILQGSRSLKHNESWCFQDLPDIIRKWSLFLPPRVEYPLPAGRVRFWSFSVNKNRYRQLHLQSGNDRPKRQRLRRYISRVFRERQDPARLKFSEELNIDFLRDRGARH